MTDKKKIDRKEIESLLNKWKTKRATTEQKAIIRDLERLLEETEQPEPLEPEIFSEKVEL